MSFPERKVLSAKVIKGVPRMKHFHRYEEITVRHELECGHAVTLVHKAPCVCNHLPCPVC